MKKKHKLITKRITLIILVYNKNDSNITQKKKKKKNTQKRKKKNKHIHRYKGVVSIIIVTLKDIGFQVLIINVTNESHIWWKICFLCLMAYVSLSIAIHEDSSLTHRFTDGQQTLFHCLAITRFTCSKQRLTSSLSCVLKDNTSGIRPRIHTSGHTGIFFWTMQEIISTKSFQNFWICLHVQIQWNKVPFSVVHFIQVSRMLGLNLWSFSGVIYVLMSQLYWINLNLLLIVMVCAWQHAFSHSSSVMSVWKSSIQAILL